MSRRGPMYFGGMILGSISDAYAYEDWLAAFVAQRNKMFEDRNTFWGRNRYQLFEMITDDRRKRSDKKNPFQYAKPKYGDECFHYIPEDPLVYIPQFDGIVVIMKRKYLVRLRQDFMKLKRRGK